LNASLNGEIADVQARSTAMVASVTPPVVSPLPPSSTPHAVSKHAAEKAVAKMR